MKQRGQATTSGAAAAAEAGRLESTPFDDLGVAVSRREPLAHHTWLGLGGEAKFFCEPVDVEALGRVVRRCHEQGIPVRVIGGGSNVLVSAEGVAGMVVRLSAPAFCGIDVQPPSLRAGAGAKLVHVVSAAVQAGLSGLETLVDVPGTVGGALVGNAGGHALQIRASTFVQEGATLLHVGSSDLARHLVPELPELLAPDFVRDPQPIIICCGRSRLVTELLSIHCRRIRVRSLAWEPARGIEAGGGLGARPEAGGEVDECWASDRG
jgi:hypothetical protein